MLVKPSSIIADLPAPDRWLEYSIEFVAVAIVYAALANPALHSASINPSASPIWPPTGSALAIALLLGFRVGQRFYCGIHRHVTTAGSPRHR